VLLELGGKSAHVVFEDADLDATCNGVVAGVFAATGQTCMAGSRLLVQRSVHDALVSKIASRAAAIRIGDPRDADTEMGRWLMSRSTARSCRSSPLPGPKAPPWPLAASRRNDWAATSSSRPC
jgi:acyl-CoA reductase-like NAD-dependent aldehyde dehydrogenase